MRGEQMSLFDDGEQSSGNAAETLSTLDGAVLMDALIEGVRAGWMISVSGSRDGFALRLAALHDGQKDAVWCEDAASAERALQGLVRSAKAAQAGEDVKPGTGGRKRS